MKNHIYCLILKNYNIDNTHSHIKAIKLRDNYRGKKQALKTKLKVLIRFFLKRNKEIDAFSSKSIIVCTSNSQNFDRATKYINQYNKNINYDSMQKYTFNKRKNTNISYRLKIRMLFFFGLLLIKSLFVKEVSASQITRIYNIVYSFFGVQAEIYIYGRLYSSQYYLAALILSEYFKLNVFYIIGSGLIYANKRYTFLKNCNFICGSKVQLEEIKSLNNEGLFLYKSLKKWGTTSSINFKTEKKYFYDIGIYSCGEWARINGLWRETDLNKIKEGIHHSNKRYVNLYQIMELLFKQVSEKKIIVYMHPFERFLLNNFNIKPPYFTLLDKYCIDVDISGNNSVEKIFECNVGIALISTIIFERLDNDLDGYIFYDPDWSEDDKLFEPGYLGKYEKFVYYSAEDLIKKLQ